MYFVQDLKENEEKVMSKKIIAAIICASVGVVGLFGLIKEFSTTLLAGCIILIVVGAGLFLWGCLTSKKQKIEPAKEVINQPAVPAPETVERAPSSIDLFADGWVLRYSYMLNLGDPVVFAARGHAGEPVEIKGFDVLLNGAKIGTLTAERQVAMVEDYHRRGDVVRTFIRSVSGSEIGIELGFYKSVDNLETKDYKVGGGSKYEDDRSLCSVGDAVMITEDFESEKLLVECDGVEIGTLSSSATNSLNTGHIIAGEIVTLDDDECVVRLFI